MRQPGDPPKVLVEASADEVTALAAELFKTTVCDAVDRRGTCSVALAGGTTPHALYQELARSAVTEEVPWEKVKVLFGDERNVPQDHVESNYRMAQRALLDHVPVRPRQVFPIHADRQDLSVAAAEYEETILAEVEAAGGAIPRFDLILLGMGGDGHVASIFPGTESVHESGKLVMAYFVPVLGRSRVTFTFALINAARNVLLLVTGADKAEAVAQLLGPDSAARKRLPAARIANEGNFCIVLDAEAARLTGLKVR